MKVVQEIEEGQHVVTPAEEPLHSVCPIANDPERFYLRAVARGTDLRVLGSFPCGYIERAGGNRDN
jgi:hypothetical protein